MFPPNVYCCSALWMTQCPDHNACSPECVSSKKCLSCIRGPCHSMAGAQKRLLHLLPLPSNFLTQRQWTARYSSQHFSTQKGLEEKRGNVPPSNKPPFLIFIPLLYLPRISFSAPNPQSVNQRTHSGVIDIPSVHPRLMTYGKEWWLPLCHLGLRCRCKCRLLT